MKFAHITSAYPEYLAAFFLKNPAAKQSYSQLTDCFFADHFAWSNAWGVALQSEGFETLEIVYNAQPIQHAWWKENRPGTPRDLESIVVEQLKDFKPDIIWFDDTSTELLARIKSEVHTIKFTLGWTGSAIVNTEVFKLVDLVLSCAQESVDKIRNLGLKSEQLHHAYDPRILDRLSPVSNRKNSICFIGQIIRGSQYHDYRSNLLERLCSDVPLSIYSSLSEYGLKDDLKYVLKYLFKAVGLRSVAPIRQKNSTLKPHLYPAVYGVEMYKTIQQHLGVLNIHADSSPKYASNMRLFETTGTGSLLLTDWRENLAELFEDNIEVLTYRSEEECLEKAKWITNNPIAAQNIAAAGQKRTLSEHTFSKRATKLAEIIRSNI